MTTRLMRSTYVYALVYLTFDVSIFTAYEPKFLGYVSTPLEKRLMIQCRRSSLTCEIGQNRTLDVFYIVDRRPCLQLCSPCLITQKIVSSPHNEYHTVVHYF